MAEAKMVNLTIEGRPVSVPEGTSILEAAKTAGILIPHYCYHPSLPFLASAGCVWWRSRRLRSSHRRAQHQLRKDR